MLSDKDKRAKYDQFGHAGVDPSYGGAGAGYGGGFDVDLGDIFNSFFGGGFGGGFGSSGSSRRADSPNAPRRGGDVHVSVALSFMEAAHGCTKTISINVLEVCSECSGSGAAKGTSATVCPDCNGEGYVRVAKRTPLGVMQSSSPCQHCGGKGKIIEKPCAKCRGNGRVRVKRSLEVNIPAGVDDEQTLQVRGRGDAGVNGGSAGNVLVVITVRPDLLFERDRYDVHVEVPISLTEAALGAEITVPTVDGIIKFTVPAGTQSGASFRLRSKGIPYLNGSGRGDEYVNVVVEVPKKLNAEQKRTLESIAESLKTEKNYEKRRSFEDRVARQFGK